MKNFVYLILLGAIVLSCKTNTEEEVELTPEEINAYMTGRDDGHNSQNSLDWEGTYSGVLPCEDCVGVETYLSIRKDLSYVLKQRWVSKENDNGSNNGEVVTSGEFSWDETGNFIELHNREEGTMKLRVGELYIRPLNDKGFELAPEKGNNFKLLKQ